MKKYILYGGIIVLGVLEIFLIYQWIVIDKGGYEPFFALINSIVLPLYMFFTFNLIRKEKLTNELSAQVNTLIAKIELKNEALENTINSLHESFVKVISKLEREASKKDSNPILSEALEEIKDGKVTKAIRAFNYLGNDIPVQPMKKQACSERISISNFPVSRNTNNYLVLHSYLNLITLSFENTFHLTKKAQVFTI